MSVRARQRFGGMALLLSTALLGGCALDTGQRPDGRTSSQPMASAGSEGASTKTSGNPACTDGVVEACVILLPSHNGVATCFHGLRLCKEGEWSACGDADDVEAQLEGEE